MSKLKQNLEILGMTEIKPLLISRIEKVLKQLEREQLPLATDISDLQRLLTTYITIAGSNDEERRSAHNNKETAVSDRDVSPSLSYEEVVADIKQDPKYLQILFYVGLRKVVSMEALPYPSDKVETMLKKGYLTIVQIKVCHELVEYYTLTLKGWSCFTRKSIVQKLKKAFGMTAIFIPTELSASQEKWTEKTFQRAVMIQQYYHSLFEKKEYMIFTYPENEKFLFGCAGEKGHSVDYTCAIIESDTSSSSNCEMMKKVLSSGEVSSLTLIADTEETAERIIRLNDITEQDKSKLLTVVLGGGNV